MLPDQRVYANVGEFTGGQTRCHWCRQPIPWETTVPMTSPRPLSDGGSPRGLKAWHVECAAFLRDLLTDLLSDHAEALGLSPFGLDARIAFSREE